MDTGFDVSVEKIVAQGKGIARLNKRVFFIPFVLPGEKIKIAPYSEKKDYSLAIPLTISSPSSYRIPPLCLVYSQCGGCQLQHSQYDFQLSLKKQVFVEQWEKIAKVVLPESLPIFPSPQIYNYRNKIEYQLFFQEEQLCTGLVSWKGERIIPVEQCPLLEEGIDKIKSFLLKFWRENLGRKTQKKMKRLTIIQYTPADYFVRITLKNPSQKIADSLSQLQKSFLPIRVEFQINSRDFSFPSYHKVSLGKFSYSVPGGSFMQINPSQFLKILEKLESWANNPSNPEFLIDLYCGAGVISLFLSSYFKRIIGIDSSQEAVTAAQRQINKPDFSHCQFFRMDLDQSFSLENISEGEKSILVLDPPRSGASAQVLQWIKEVRPEEIFYLSCDGGTFCRDLKQLDQEYAVEELTLWDMFPQTHHLEILARLKRKDSL